MTLETIFPPAKWLKEYQRSWLPKDVLAGVTLAAYAIPVSLAYASLAGMPPQNGIYCYLLGGLFYALFGTSRQLAIGPTSAISMLVGVTIAGIAAGDPSRWIAIAGLTALVVAAMCVIAWALRLSTLISFISETILVGFKAGAALTIAMTQLPKLFGVKGGGEHFFERIWILAGQLGSTNIIVLCFGLGALLFLILGEKFLPGRPIALLLVIVSIIVVTKFSLDQYGIKVVGELPAGLPDLQLPSLRLRDVDGVVPLAFACFLLAYIEGISAARAIADKHDQEIDSRQELLALGASNFAVSLGQGYPVAGGLSQSVVNDKAGAKTPLALFFSSISLTLCLLFLTGLLRNLPSVVLAAIVLMAVKGLINISAIRHLYRVDKFEFRVSMIAFVGVLILGILKGVMLASIASLLMLLARASRPHVAFLGRIPGTKRYSDLERNPDNEILPGILIFRAEAPLLYFNTEYIRKTVLEKVYSASPKLVICDLSNSPRVDLAGARALAKLSDELKGKGISLRLAETRASVRDILRAEHLEERVGTINRRVSVDDIVESASRV
ncbi:MAG TPA: SulP family inorganic anion transporter [Acidobacteriota bacterium]|nr:SulP family inorganic anion transporter [Acidobacteriota bacterium]